MLFRSTATLVVNKREVEEDIVFGLPVGDENLARRDGPALPSYVSQYPPERVSSACSCMTIPTLTATATIPVTAVIPPYLLSSPLSLSLLVY